MALSLLWHAGCAVPQPRGNGTLSRIVEPQSKRGYWLYLPETYVASTERERTQREWPTVVTFHGMKPFDGAHAQACEWQQEADRYGFVVVAPELRAPDVLDQFPLRTVHPRFAADEEATLKVLDHVFSNTHASPKNVLATSWSSGGYMAHYMMNRHPDRFTCVAPRQSNFSSAVMRPSAARQSRYHPILIINTQNDFDICKRESREAVQWYERHGYKNVAWVYIKNLGHERTPDLAADFFGKVAGVEPIHPPEVLVQRQAVDGNAEGLAFLSGRMSSLKRPPSDTAARQPDVTLADDQRQAAARPAGYDKGQTPPPILGRSRSPERLQGQRVGISVTSSFDISPLHFGYSARVPAEWYDTAAFEWTLNGRLIGNDPNGRKTIVEPGDYMLRLVVTTADDQRFEDSWMIRVLPRTAAATGS